MAVAGDTNYIASGLIEQISADAVIAFNDAGVTRNLVKSMYFPNADTASFQKWNLGTNTATSGDVSAHTAGTQLSGIVINSDKATATLAMYPAMTYLYDETLMSNVGDPAGEIGRLLGNAVAAKADNLLNALFDGFSNAGGTSTVGLTVDNLYSAVASIESNGGMGRIHGVFDPRQIVGTYGLLNDLVTSQQFGGSPALQNEGLVEAFVRRVAGVDIYKSREFTETSNAVKAGVFTSDALGFAYAGPQQLIRMGMQREEDYLRTLYVASAFMGVVEIADGWGYELHTKVS